MRSVRIECLLELHDRFSVLILTPRAGRQSDDSSSMRLLDSSADAHTKNTKRMGATKGAKRQQEIQGTNNNNNTRGHHQHQTAHGTHSQHQDTNSQHQGTSTPRRVREYMVIVACKCKVIKWVVMLDVTALL